MVREENVYRSFVPKRSHPAGDGHRVPAQIAMMLELSLWWIFEMCTATNGIFTSASASLNATLVRASPPRLMMMSST